MLKYQLKKDVQIEPGFAFRYKTAGQRVAILTALGHEVVTPVSLQDNGLVIIKGFGELIEGIQLSKYLFQGNQKIVKKKDYFSTVFEDKCNNERKFIKQCDVNTDGDTGAKNFFDILYKHPNIISKDKEFSNSDGRIGSIHMANAKEINTDACTTDSENKKKPFVGYAITGECGFRVPLGTCKEGILTDTHRVKGVFMEGVEKDPFKEKKYLFIMESDRIKKLVSSKFPLFIRTGIYNIGSPTPSVSFKIPGTVYDFKVTIEDEKVIDIEFDFNSNDDAFVYTNFLKELIASYFKVEKPKTKEGTKFECVTDLNGESRVLMTDCNGKKTTLI